MEATVTTTIRFGVTATATVTPGYRVSTAEVQGTVVEILDYNENWSGKYWRVRVAR